MIPAADMMRYATASRKLGFWGPLGLGGASLLTGLASAANDATHQRRGERLPTLAGNGLGLTTRVVSQYALASGLTLIPGIGPITAGLIAGAATFYPNARFQDFAGRSFRKMSAAAARIRHLEVGGTFEDSLSARASRLSAIQQMNGSMVASRRYLGQEATIYHR